MLLVVAEQLQEDHVRIVDHLMVLDLVVMAQDQELIHLLVLEDLDHVDH
tara:strand:- start:115 stop:261 length:147 start_codon:yes stop_codon:yes gene_type:complete